MTTPIETMEWLVAQFRDRANADPEEHTKKDAKEVEALSAAFAAMLTALKEIQPGSADHGRWLDSTGDECEEDDEGAEWYEYTDEEQRDWLDTVAATAQAAIDKAEGRADALQEMANEAEEDGDSPTADQFMWDVAEYHGGRDLTHNVGFQDFCNNVFGRLTIEQAAEEWERR